MPAEAVQLSVPQYDSYVRTEWKLLVARRLTAPDVSIADLAKGLGYNQGTVRNWLRNPLYQRYENWVIETHRAELAEVPVAASPRFKAATVPERFEEYQAEMQERLLDIIETSENQKLVADLCKDWLAYGGVVPKGAAISGNRAPAMTEEMLLMFAQRAKESGLEMVVAGVKVTSVDGNS